MLQAYIRNIGCRIHHTAIAHAARSLGALGVVLAVCLSGCDGSEQKAAASHNAAGKQPQTPYRVVTTVAMITDLVKQVAGDRATVQGLIGEGVDPHLYKPTRNDVVAMQQADVIFYNGLVLEGKMGDVFVQMARSGKDVHPVSESLDRDYLLEPPGFSGHYDPHVWMDVQAWIQSLDVITEVLSEYDPAGAVQYHKRAAELRPEMQKLDDYVRAVMATVPKEQRVLITAHDAFNYFGRAYDIEVRGIQGISTESEAGVSDINDLVSFLVDRKIKAVFVETSVADKNVRALVEGAAARGHQVTIGGSLFSDAMGEAGTYEGTYLGMLDHNATVIARALGGDAPARGMQGKLAERKPDP